MKVRRTTMIGAVSAIGLLAGACGDSRPSAEAFAERVTSICAATQQRHDEAARGFDFEAFNPDTSNLATIVPVIEKNVAIGREANRELKKVRGPKAEEAKLQQYVTVAAQMHALGEKEAEAARRGDRVAFKALIEEEDALVAKLPKEGAFEGC